MHSFSALISPQFLCNKSYGQNKIRTSALRVAENSLSEKYRHRVLLHTSLQLLALIARLNVLAA